MPQQTSTLPGLTTRQRREDALRIAEQGLLEGKCRADRMIGPWAFISLLANKARFRRLEVGNYSVQPLPSRLFSHATPEIFLTAARVDTDLALVAVAEG